jgi:apolipoprotein N-acyltransferase
MPMKEGLSLSNLSLKPNHLLPLLSGTLLALSLPKWNLSFLALLSLIPFFFYLRSITNTSFSFRKVAISSLLFGLSYFMITFYWIVYTLHKFSPLPLLASIFLLILLCFYLSLYFLLLFLISVRFKLFSEANFLKGIVFALLWVGSEYARSKLLTGLPWGLLGEALANFPLILQTADLLGVYGLSFLAALSNYTLFLLLEPFFEKFLGLKSKSPNLKRAIPLLILILSFFAYGLFAEEYWQEKVREEKRTLRVALLQGNIPQELKERKEVELSLEVYKRLFLRALSLKPDIVFTPETAFPFYFPYEKDWSAKLLSFLIRTYEEDKSSFPQFVFGAFRVSFAEGAPRGHNTLFVWDGENISDIYDKERLVPFGEYIPLGEYFPFLRKISVVSDVLKPGVGKNLRIKLKERVIEITPLICFESAFSEIARKRVVQGGELIFVATNDAWFGKTSAPYQHFQMLKLRAVENRRFAIQAANTGISGIVSPLGKVLVYSGLETQEVINAEVKALHFKTFYQKYGYLFPIACGLVYFGSCLFFLFEQSFPRIRIFLSKKKLN